MSARKKASLIFILFALNYLKACGSEETFRSSHTRDGVKTAEEKPRRWEDAVDLYLEDDAVTIEDELLEAINFWNQVADKEVIRFAGYVENEYDSTTDMWASLLDDKTVVYLEREWEKRTREKDSVLGTTLSIESYEKQGIIERADILINASGYLWTDTLSDECVDLDSWGFPPSADLKSVLIHEVGHLLGIGHSAESEDNPSVMNAYMAVGCGNALRKASSFEQNEIGRRYTE